MTAATSRADTTTGEFPTHAVLFRVRLGEAFDDKAYIYFVQATTDCRVNGFPSMRRGLDYFENAYKKAHERGQGFSAGALINHMYLSPRVFKYGTMDELKKLLGETVYPEKLSGTGMWETVFRCKDQEAAKAIYDEAVEPRLTG